MRVIVFLFFILLFSSCSHYRWIHKNEKEVCEILNCVGSERTVSHVRYIYDTTDIQLNPVSLDSSYLNEFLQCDSNNRVLMRENENLKEDKDSVFIERTVTVEKTKTRMDTIYQTITKEVPKVVKEKHVPLAFWIIGSVLLVLAFVFGLRLRF